MIRTIGADQAEQWDAAVRSFREYDVYWLNGYVRGFRIHGDGEPLLICYEDGGTRGINVVMKRDVAKAPAFAGRIPEGVYFDFSTPYGYGGWLIEGEETDALFRAYTEWLRANGILCEFVRFHPMIRNHEACADFYETVRLGEVVHMDLSSPETVWANLSSKNRNMIRKAEKNGITIRTGRDPEMYEAFREMYNATMDRDEAEEYYYFGKPFYDSLREDLAEKGISLPPTVLTDTQLAEALCPLF